MIEMTSLDNSLFALPPAGHYVHKRGIHKGCRHLGGGRGLAIMGKKAEKGREGV